MQIVYVDDDDLLLEIAKMFLSDQGIAVTCVDSALAAESIVLALRPDLILLDVMMPDQDGLATLRQIRRHRSLDSTPVVFVTGDAEEADVRLLMQAGAAGVIAKPFVPARLAEDVRRFIGLTAR
jgi:DNA-binding response OmpR family regulator